MTHAFDYQLAFDRNIGWVTEPEQQVLRSKRVAIAGMGGVGGVHVVTLARLGVQRFNIADFDTFDIANFNRQVGATMSSLGRPKADVLAEMVRDINPEADVRVYPAGIDDGNVADFLHDADLCIDGLDFYAFHAREITFAACAKNRIPAITVAPIGMGAALLNFLPGQMSFEEYFGWQGQDEMEKALRFLVGLAPRGLHRGYLLDPSKVDFKRKRAPSTIMGCQFSAGVAATESLKILLQRGTVLAAPYGVHFDGYRNMIVRTWRPGGHRNPLQRLLLALGRRQLARMLEAQP